MSKPKLKIEQAMNGEIPWSTVSRPPHCDARILHEASVCDLCASSPELQEERRLLSVSNTGTMNRLWPCPADQARSTANMNAWYGNTPHKK